MSLPEKLLFCNKLIFLISIFWTLQGLPYKNIWGKNPDTLAALMMAIIMIQMRLKIDFHENTVNILKKETDLSFTKSKHQRPVLLTCLKSTVCSKHLRFNYTAQMVV